MQLIKSLIVMLVFIAIVVLNQKYIQPLTTDALHQQTIISKNIQKGAKTPKKYDQPDKAAEWLASMRRAPKGTSPAQLNLSYLNELEKAKANKAVRANQDLPALQFDEIGPGIFGGRIRGFVMHPEREGHLLAGGVSGGVWKSTDDGKTWQPKTDFLASIAIGSMLIDPDNPEVVYVGTGEGFFNFDAAQGNGIFVTEDFGETWDRFGSTNQTNFDFVNRLAKIPNSNVILAATSKGLFKSNDGGELWNEVSGVDVDDNDRGFTDLKIDPTDPNHMLAYYYGEANSVSFNFNVSPPSTVSGTYASIPAQFGPSIPGAGISGELLLVDDGTNPTSDGCEAITNDITGKIALIERGSCNFTVKVVNAQNAGAIAVVVFQNSSDDPFSMGGDDPAINIPSVMISKVLGDFLRIDVPPVNITIQGTEEINLDRFIMRSTNGGDLWVTLDNHGLPDLDVDRMEIAFGSDGKTYIAVSKPTEEFDNGTTNGTLGLYRSIGTNNTFFEKTASNTNFIERQGWYDLAIAVNPNDSDHVIMGAVDQYATTNGGTTINKTSLWTLGSLADNVAQYIHADHHGYFFSPFNSNHFYVVSDGGVSKSEDGGDSFFSLNNGLNISQSYGIAVSPDGQRVTSGTQDNGSQLFFGDEQAWLEWRGGDGGYSAWDQQQDNFVYGSFVNGAMYGSNNGGFSTENMDLPDTDGARFIQPFVLDENDGNRMLVGTDNVFYTNNARSLGSATWSDVSGNINGTGISALAFDPHQSTIAYAGMSNSNTAGTNQIIKITGLGSSNQVTDVAPATSLGTPTAVVTDIKVDLFDTSGNTIYATFGDYATNRILRSTDGGSSWDSISNNLPAIPLYQVINDPADANTLYLGSELGLWVGTRTGNTFEWTQFDYGPALTRVIDLVWNNDNLYVGTHGRGTYIASRNPVELSLVKFIGTNSSCDLDNVLDRGEAGQLIIQVKNNSAKDLGNVTLTFNEPNFIDIPSASQIVNLTGFSTQSIAVDTRLSSQASCLANISIPVTINSIAGEYNTEIPLLTAANLTTNNGTFSDGAEDVDSRMTTELALGADGWIQASDSFNSGSSSWFTTDESSYSDKSLVTPWLTFDRGGNVLSFAMSYDTEGDSFQRWDGLVLEMRLKGTDNWFDIGYLSTVPYDGQLYTNNTAQAQFAWSGTQLTWRETSVDLGTDYVGKTAKIRFRMISDGSAAQEGFWLDDIAITHVFTNDEVSCDACISDNNSKVPLKGLWYDPAHDGHGFIIEAFGANELFYTLFYTYDDSGDPEWYASLTPLSNGVLNPDFNAQSLGRFNYNYNVDPTQVDPLVPDPTLTDGRLSIDFNSEDVRNHAACQDGTSRQLDFVALATFKIDNITQEWCIEPLIDNPSRPEPDFGTAWWAGIEDNGWGYSLAQTGDVIIAFLFYYDALGNPRWSTGATGGFAKEQDIVVPMNDVFGYGRTQPMIDRTTIPSGNMTLNLSNTFRDLDTDGTNSIDVTYQGAEGGRWLRNNIKIMTLLREH